MPRLDMHGKNLDSRFLQGTDLGSGIPNNSQKKSPEFSLGISEVIQWHNCLKDDPSSWKKKSNKLRSLSSPKGVLFRESSLIAVSAAERSEASFIEKREAECEVLFCHDMNTQYYWALSKCHVPSKLIRTCH